MVEGYSVQLGSLAGRCEPSPAGPGQHPDNNNNINIRNIFRVS